MCVCIHTLSKICTWQRSHSPVFPNSFCPFLLGSFRIMTKPLALGNWVHKSHQITHLRAGSECACTSRGATYTFQPIHSRVTEAGALGFGRTHGTRWQCRLVVNSGLCFQLSIFSRRALLMRRSLVPAPGWLILPSGGRSSRILKRT